MKNAPTAGLFAIALGAATCLALPESALGWVTTGRDLISQDCVDNTGCLDIPGSIKEPGFPQKITVSGSYALSSNLTVPKEKSEGGGKVAAIEIDIDSNSLGPNNVTIHLNGFTIRHEDANDNGCIFGTAGDEISNPFGGISILGGPGTNVRIVGGTIHGFGYGILAKGASVQVEDMYLCGNNTGVWAGPGSIIRNSRILGHYDDAIKLEHIEFGGGLLPIASIIEDNVISGTSHLTNNMNGDCIDLKGDKVKIWDNVISDCQGYGIFAKCDGCDDAAGANVLIGENVITNNVAGGVFVDGGGANILNNMISMNGGDGVLTHDHSRIFDNTIEMNGGFGLNLGAEQNTGGADSPGDVDGHKSAWGNNVITGNNLSADIEDQVNPPIDNSNDPAKCPAPGADQKGAPVSDPMKPAPPFGNAGGNVVAGYALAPSSCCGNGIVEGNEHCDDGDADNADGCDARCLLTQ